MKNKWKIFSLIFLICGSFLIFFGCSGDLQNVTVLDGDCKTTYYLNEDFDSSAYLTLNYTNRTEKIKLSIDYVAGFDTLTLKDNAVAVITYEGCVTTISYNVVERKKVDITNYTISNTTITFDNAFHKPTLSNIDNDVNVSMSINGQNFIGARNKGTYNLVITLFGEGYNTKEVNVVMTILPKELTTSCLKSSYVYDGQNHTPVINLVGCCFGDTDAISPILSNGVQKNVGNYICTITSVSNPNYTLSVDSVKQYNYTITPKSCSIVISNKTITYGTIFDSSCIEYVEYNNGTNIIDGDLLTFAITSQATDNGYKAGTYNFTCTNANTNYTATIYYANATTYGKVIINKKSVDITIFDVNAYYGEDLKTPTIALNNNYSFAFDDNSSDLMLTYSIKDNSSNVIQKNSYGYFDRGTYNIVAEFNTNSNYISNIRSNGKYNILSPNLDITNISYEISGDNARNMNITNPYLYLSESMPTMSATVKYGNIDVEGVFTWNSSEIIYNETGVQTFTWTFTPADINFGVKTGTQTFTIINS